jgi:nicotinamidase/pyrazinamidase
MEITSHDLLVVIDVQNDFCPGGVLAVPEGDQVIDIIHKVASKFQHIILTQDWHPLGHSSFAGTHPGYRPLQIIKTAYGDQTLWPDHCVQGTAGADFHRLLSLPNAELVLRKGYRVEVDSYSAFFENDRTTPTGLAGYLRERGLKRLFLAGLAYDFCVGFSALDAVRLGFDAVVLSNACRPIAVGDSVSKIEEEFRRAGVCLSTTERLDSVPSKRGKSQDLCR